MKCNKCGEEISDANKSPYDDLCKNCYETKCEDCYYNMGPCMCEDLMAAGCIPTYKTDDPLLKKLRLMSKGEKQTLGSS